MSWDPLLVAAAGAAAGAINAAAGGGTLIAFPALVATGIPARTANMTCSVGLLGGYVGSSVGYRRELGGQRARARSLGVSGVAGALCGAGVLIATPAASFRSIVPYLILVACGLLGVQSRVATQVARHQQRSAESLFHTEWPTRIGVFVSAVYGTYFGAGLSVLLLAVLGIFVDDDLQRLNALKGVLALVVNVIGVAVFVVAGSVSWVYAVVLAVSAFGGGSFGVVVARRLRPAVLRGGVVTFGVVVAVVLILRG